MSTNEEASWKHLFAEKEVTCRWRQCAARVYVDEFGVMKEHEFPPGTTCPGSGYDFSKSPESERHKMRTRAMETDAEAVVKELIAEAADHRPSLRGRIARRLAWEASETRANEEANWTLLEDRHKNRYLKIADDILAMVKEH